MSDLVFRTEELTNNQIAEQQLIFGFITMLRKRLKSL